MKLLCITDTHGELDIINELIAQHKPDAVLHAGDFGFYDNESPERLTDRELALHIRFSTLPDHVRNRVKKMTRSDMVTIIREQCPMSQLPDYIHGTKQFHAPIYAVWGNHEDLHVISKFVNKKLNVENLHLLDHRISYNLGPFKVFGLGGNLLPGKKFFMDPPAGSGGKVWTTFEEYIHLVRHITSAPTEDYIRLMITHISPGKEPLATLLGALTRADCCISGHMDPPHFMSWNEFAVRSPEEALKRIESRISMLRETWKNIRAFKPIEKQAFMDEALDKLSCLPEDRIQMGRSRVPRWFAEMSCFNLPDTPAGCLILELDGYARFRWQWVSNT